MTALMSKRKRFTSVLATATAALVVASGMSLAPTVAFAAEAPVLTVTPATGLTDGDAVTVTGSGYNPNQAIYVTTCTDAELADVDFGFINQGCTDGAALVWQHGAGRGLEFEADGSFSTTMNLKQREGTTALYTIANHTAMGDRSQDAKASLSFVNDVEEPEVPETPSVDPQVVLSGATDLDASVENTITVNGTGFTGAGAAFGAYVAIGEQSLWNGESAFPANGWVQIAFVPKAQVIDGKFTTTLTVPAGTLDPEKNYQIVTTAAHGLSATDRSLDTFTPVTLKAPVATPTVTPTVKTATKGQLTIEAKVANIPASSGGIYAAVTERGNDSLGQEDMGLATYITKGQLNQGAATGTISISGDDLKSLDRTKQYQVIVWEHRSFPTAENTYARADLNITSAQWDAVFKKDEPKPEVKIPFTDVKKGDKFFKEISWMYTAKITTGVKQADGSVKYLPKGNVTREAMAAFLFRQYGEAGYVAPKKSVFTDVKPGDKFYKEVAWMADKGYSTGNKQADGKTFKYLPKESVTREAMAAFIYRIEKDKPATKKVSFNDVKPGHKFYKEISWMGGTGVSTGNKLSNGTYDYKPSDSVTREAMAAFMQRADAL